MLIKPEYKEIEVTFDVVLSMEKTDGSTTSTSTDGTTSDSETINIDGPISFGSSTDKATGATTQSVTFGKQVGTDDLNVTPSISADSNGDLTGAVQVKVGPAGVAVQGKVPASGIIHTIKTFVSKANDTLTTSPSGR